METRFPSMALLGLGYMGGSVALGLRARGIVDAVTGYDVDAAAAQVALRRGIVDKVVAFPEESVKGADLVVLATPVRALGDLGRRIEGHVAPTALVIDLGSVKGDVQRQIDLLSLAGQFVGCHPLAGTEVTGPEAADPNLYEGRSCYLCPGPKVRPESVDAARRIWAALGARTMVLDAVAHDEVMAAGSHLPHVAAFALALALEPKCQMLVARTPGAYPPTSLRDTTRIAASNPAMWRDIFLMNRDHLLPVVRQLQDAIRVLADAIEAGDADRLQRSLETARAVRMALVKSAPEGG